MCAGCKKAITPKKGQVFKDLELIWTLRDDFQMISLEHDSLSSSDQSVAVEGNGTGLPPWMLQVVVKILKFGQIGLQRDKSNV